MSGTNVIELNNVSKKYDYFNNVLTDVSFKLPKGYVMGLVGPSGSGKTTLIKLLMGLLLPQDGDIKIFDMNHNDNSVEIKDRIGFVYDDSPYYLNYSLEKNKNIVAPFYSNWCEDDFDKYMKLFKLDRDKKVSELSKGMKMKFSLAMALSHKAELLIMDEPTAGLDPLFRRELLDILFSIIKENEISILFSTHITSDLDKIADYITIINEGKVLLSTELEELLDTNTIVKGPLYLLSDELKESLVGYSENKYGFEGLTASLREVKETYGDKLVYENPSIEDIMLYYIKSEV